MGKIPSQVRIRTDPEDGYGHRYESIQNAKEVFNVGNNTAAVISATQHAYQDVRNKRETIEYLAEHVGDDVLEEVAERLTTRQISIEIKTEVNVRTEK